MNKEDLIFTIQVYGFVNPKNKEITASQFIENIKAVYDCTLPWTNRAIQALESYNHALFRFNYDGQVEVRS